MRLEANVMAHAKRRSLGLKGSERERGRCWASCLTDGAGVTHSSTEF